MTPLLSWMLVGAVLLGACGVVVLLGLLPVRGDATLAPELEPIHARAPWSLSEKVGLAGPVAALVFGLLVATGVIGPSLDRHDAQRAAAERSP